MEENKKPSDGTFQQQRLRAWQPLLTPPWVSCMFGFVFILFIILGSAIITASKSVVDAKVRYDNQPQCKNSSLCYVSLTVPKQMKPPVFFYYELTNFNQNHRRYVKSRADSQLRGVNVHSGLSSCDPLITWNSTTLYPCGVIANSFFNDTFLGALCRSGQPNCTAFVNDSQWSEHDIAWPTDKTVKIQRSKSTGTYQYWSRWISITECNK